MAEQISKPAFGPRELAAVRAEKELLEQNHDLTTRTGILIYLSAAGQALVHDAGGMTCKKANACAHLASVARRAGAT